MNGVYLPYLAQAGALGVLVRPDFYVFGQACAPEDYRALIATLREHVSATALIR